MKDVTWFIGGVLLSSIVMFPIGVLFWLEVFRNATVEDNTDKLARSAIQQVARLKPAGAIKECFVFERQTYCEYSLNGQRRYLVIEDTK